MGKNLEAIDQGYKGIFRTPFAFLLGGPVGLIANAAYTAYKVNDEIKTEARHKEYLKTLVAPNQKTLKEFYEERERQKNLEKQKEIEKVEYLKSEFSDGKDISFDDGFHFRYITDDKFTYKDRYYEAIFHYKDPLFGWRAKYYPIDEFISMYENDKKAGNIIEKNRFYNNEVRATFGYKTNQGYFFTGMFTLIN